MPLQIISHPLIQHKMALLRDAATPSLLFRALVEEITFLLAYDATQNLDLVAKKIQTPLEETVAKKITTPVVILPILRAALGMIDPFLKLMPWASVGHMGVYRDENTLQPHVYYFKIPLVKPEQQYFICDPMLATGGTVSATITYLKNQGINKIIFVSLIAAPEGVKFVSDAHPDVTIYTACLDRELNSQGYILPGLGDAGDRLYGTEGAHVAR